MSLLLDTHVLLAILDGRPDALGSDIARVANSQDHAFFVSVASLWEIAVKWRLGKLPLSVGPASLPALVEEIGIVMLAITPAHVLATVDPEPCTRDPFDRLLLAVCRIEGLRLVTIDRALVGHPYALKLG